MKKAFISFHFLFGIGTSQWVMADSNKKILSRSQALKRNVSDGLPLPLGDRRGQAKVEFH
jgi:hypothetical protein